MHETVEKPVFGVNIDSNDGYWVWGPVSMVVWSLTVWSPAKATRVPWLPLRPGSYTMSTSIQGKGGRPDYDIFARASRFAVSSSARQESAGRRGHGTPSSRTVRRGTLFGDATSITGVRCSCVMM